MSLICGVGVFDCVGESKTKDYFLWREMLRRCYTPSVKLRTPNYKDCSVDDFFFVYSNFKSWVSNQFGHNQQGFQLDKDILVKGNKVYSPNTCVFVPKEINCLIIPRKSVRGEYPIGVTFDPKIGKFRSQMNAGGKKRHMGLFVNPEEAFLAYKEAKEAYIKEVANKWKEQIDPRVYDALMNYQVEITD